MISAPELPLQQRTAGERIFALDAVRGIAAFTVIWYHFRLAFESREPRWYFTPFFAGHQAVILFFVLSGYVLSIPYWRGGQKPYVQYLIRRLFRIYVPYVGAVLFAVTAAWHLSGAQLPLTPWFYKTWHTELTGRLLVQHLFMGGWGQAKYCILVAAL